MNVVLGALPWFGALFSLYGTISYARGVNRRETRPQLASWIGWGTANAVFCVLAVLHGNYLAAGFNAIAAAGNFGVLLLSTVRRVGIRPEGTTDWTCLALTGSCLLTIVLTHGSPYVAFLAMAANIAATWPTIQHAWRKPHEEKWNMFAANVGANALGLVGVVSTGGMGLANIAGPLISMLGNVALVSITLGRGWMANAIKSTDEAINAEVAAMQAAIAADLAALTPEADERELVTVGPRAD